MRTHCHRPSSGGKEREKKERREKGECNDPTLPRSSNSIERFRIGNTGKIAKLISEQLVQFGRYTDRDPQAAVQYAYAVEAVDREYNVSALLVGEESGNLDR